MDILQFVNSDEVDPIYFQASYYVAPDDKTAKPYVLFLAALKAAKQDAIAKIAMHNREHIVLIRPSREGGLVLHTLYYPGELHKANRSEPPKTKYSAKELELARSLVSQLKAPFKPRNSETSTARMWSALSSRSEKARRLLQSNSRARLLSST